MSNIQMRPSHILEAIKLAFHSKRPFFIHGQPGAGKSDLFRQACKDLGIELRDVRASQLESVDLRGLPHIENNTTLWSIPCFLPPMFVPLLDKDGKQVIVDGVPQLTPNMSAGILFLDELNQATQSTQAAAYQLILDRRLGDYILPQNWVVCAAGNRAIDRSIANKMGSALKNRFVHAEIIVDADEWIKWAILANIHPSIVGYIKFRPANLNDLSGHGNEGKKRMEAALEGNAFATPRSWAFASELLLAKPHPEIEYAVLAGTIGEANVADFMGFLKVYRNLPDLDKLIEKPMEAKVPTDMPTLYALSSGLSAKTNMKTIENVMKYVGRLPAEFQVMIIKEAQIRDFNLTTTKPYVEWLTKNTNLL